MSIDAEQFLAAFEALPSEVRDEVTAAILRGTEVSVEADSRVLLRQQIQQGIDSPGVPAEQAIARLEKAASELSKGQS